MTRTLFRALSALLGQAGQAVEPAALIPLQMLAPRGSVVLVGDPQQLPATVLSRAARKAGLALSLFERLQQVHMDPLQLRKAVHHLVIVWKCSAGPHADKYRPPPATHETSR